MKWFNVKSGYGFINRYALLILIKSKDQFATRASGASKDLQACLSDKGCACPDSCPSFFHYTIIMFTMMNPVHLSHITTFQYLGTKNLFFENNYLTLAKIYTG